MLTQDPEFDPSVALSDLDNRIMQMNRELQAGLSAFLKQASLQTQKFPPLAKAGQKRRREEESSTDS